MFKTGSRRTALLPAVDRSKIRTSLICIKTVIFQNYVNIERPPFKVVGEVLSHPSVLFASHQYFPWSLRPTAWNSNCEWPLNSVADDLGTGWPFLYHLMTGRGIPVALQVKVALPLMGTISWRGFLTRNRGGDGSAKKRKFSSLWILTQKCFEVAYLWYNKQKYAVVIITSLSPGGRKGRGEMGWLQDFGSVMIKLTWSPPPSSLAVNRPSLFYNSPLILIWRRLTLPHPGCSPLKPWDTRSPRPPKMTGS